MKRDRQYHCSHRVYRLVGDSGKQTGISLSIFLPPLRKSSMSMFFHVSDTVLHVRVPGECHFPSRSWSSSDTQLVYVSDKMIIQRKNWPFMERGGGEEGCREGFTEEVSLEGIAGYVQSGRDGFQSKPHIWTIMWNYMAVLGIWRAARDLVLLE